MSPDLPSRPNRIRRPCRPSRRRCCQLRSRRAGDTRPGDGRPLRVPGRRRDRPGRLAAPPHLAPVARTPGTSRPTRGPRYCWPRRGKGDPLAHPRLTVIGPVARDEPDPQAARASWPATRRPRLYADFPDFSFWRLAIAGRAPQSAASRASVDLTATELLTDFRSGDLLAAEDDALEHLNARPCGGARLYATELAGGARGALARQRPRSRGARPRGRRPHARARLPGAGQNARRRSARSSSELADEARARTSGRAMQAQRPTG